MPVPQTDSAPIPEQQLRIPSRWEQPHAEADDFTAFGAEQGERFQSATESVVRGLSDQAAQATDHANIANAVWADGVSTDASAAFTKALDDNKDNAGKDLPTLMHNNVIQPYIQQALGNAQKQGLSDVATKQLVVNLNRIGGDAISRSIGMETVARANASINSLNDSISKANDTVSMNPAGWQDQQQLLSSMVDGLQQSNYLTPEGVQKYRGDVANLAVTAARSTLGSDPAGAQKIMDSARGVEPNLRFAVANEIKAAGNTKDSLAQYNALQTFDSNRLSVRQTGQSVDGFTKAGYVSSFPADQQEVRAREFDAAQTVDNAVFKNYSMMDGAPPAKIQDVLNKAAPVAGSSSYGLQSEIYKYTQEQATENIRQFQQDPYSYSMRDPVVGDVQRRAQQLAQNPMVASPGSAIRANQELIKASMAWQATAGVPQNLISVAPRPVVAQAANQINTLKGDDWTNSVKALQQTYGGNFPDLMRNMSQLPEAERLNPEAGSMILNMDKSYGKDLSGNLQASLLTAEKNFTEQEKTTFNESIALNPLVSSLKSSMLAGGANFGSNVDMNSQMLSLNNAIKKDAYGLYQSGQATTPDDAVAKAAQRQIGSNYDFTEMNGKKIQIPKMAASPDPSRGRQGIPYTPEDIQNIRTGMDAWVDKFSVGSVDKESFGLDPRLTGFNDANVKQAIKDHAFFFLNSDMRSYTLMIPAANDAGAQPVTANKKPVTVPISTLLNVGQSSIQNNTQADPLPFF